MSACFIRRAHMTPIGRHETDFISLSLQAAEPILKDADVSRIERVYFSAFAPRELCDLDDPAATLATALLQRYQITAEMVGPYRTGGEAMFHALASAGHSGDILLIGCEKMTHVPAAKAAGLLAPRVSDDVEIRHGATLPALAAFATQAYMKRFRVPYHAFHDVAVKNHYHAAMNPNAHFRRTVTSDDVASSPMIADPLRRHHCAPTSDGAAAALLSREGGPVRFIGWGEGVDAHYFHDRRDPARFPAAKAAAHDAFSMAGVAADDIDVVEIHDAFSPFELMNLEEMGFFPPGSAWHALAAGELTVGGGRVAVNPSGGMKGRGHPIGVCGLSSLYEMSLQLTGTAGARQQPRARRGVIQSAGGVSRETWVFALESVA